MRTTECPDSTTAGVRGQGEKEQRSRLKWRQIWNDDELRRRKRK